MRIKKNTDDFGRIKVKIFRESGGTYLQFSVSDEIEQLWKERSTDIAQSRAWGIDGSQPSISGDEDGLRFYSNPDIQNSPSYIEMLDNYNLFDNYGGRFKRDNKINIAWVRTVGGGGKIKIDDIISFSEISVAVKNIIAFLREYFQEYIEDAEVNGELRVKIK